MNWLKLTIVLLTFGFPMCFGRSRNCSTILLPRSDGESLVRPVLEKYEVLLLMIIGFGGFSTIVAKLYLALRKNIYHDEHNLDTVFDAGGRVTFSLTAVTVTSQMLWPADFLQTATITNKIGIGGSLWYSFAVVLNILLFPLLSTHLKIRAPGAKTFLQIIYARFGPPAHIVCCCAALLTNVITTTALILAGQTLLQTLAKDISNELVLIVLALIFGSYCFIGGLGTTFYISYFNTALTLISVVIFVMNVNTIPEEDMDSYASMKSMYEALMCLEGPNGNYDNSFMTFRSRPGIIFGTVLFFSAASFFVHDQASWQSRIAAKPTQGVIGFFISAFLWFPIPASIAIRSSMMYLSQSYLNGSHLLTEKEIDSGFITPYMMVELMGTGGAYLLIIMISMSLMSTGSGEIMSISSIIIYDIYKVYVNPFRKHCASPTSCVLCGKEKVKPFNCSKTTDNEYCSCKSAENCHECLEDITKWNNTTQRFGIKYLCETHGLYRHYEDLLLHYKSWCFVWVTAGIVPFGLMVVSSGVDLNWAVFTLPVVISPFLVSLVLTITWARATGHGVIIGGLSGLVASLVGNLVVASVFYEDGLSAFLINTSADYSLLAAIGAGLMTSSIMTVVISLHTTRVRTKEDALMEWEKTLSIDNPVNPWRVLYRKEFRHISPDARITSEMMAKLFRRTTLITTGVGICAIVMFLAFIPGIMLKFEVLTYEEFYGYLLLFQIWGIIAAAFAIIVPPVEEIIHIIRHRRMTKRFSEYEEKNCLG